MAATDLGQLTLSDVKQLTYSNVFDRGYALYQSKSLENLTRRGHLLTATYHGSEPKAYAIRAHLSKDGVSGLACTCPFEGDGPCKHVIALLLAWVHTPEAFTEAEPPNKIRQALEANSSADLTSLILKLCDCEPRLLPIVERFALGSVDKQDLTKTRRSLKRALKRAAGAGYDYDWSDLFEEVELHLESAATLEESRPEDAGLLYLTILEALIEAGEDFFHMDEEGELLEFPQRCVEGIKNVLSRVGPETHVQCLQTLSRAFLFDLNLGGIGFAGEAGDVLVGSPSKDWPVVEERLNATLAAPGLSNWSRGCIVRLKSRYFEKQGDKAAAEEILLEAGTPEQRVQVFVRRGDFKSAEATAQESFSGLPGLVKDFANTLAQEGQWPLAKKWAQRHNLKHWLAEECARRGEPEALPLNLEIFEQSPSFQRWRQVIGLAPFGEREDLKAKLWSTLENGNYKALQFDIRLEEENLDAALALWPLLSAWEKEKRYNLLIELAEKTDTDAAVTLCVEKAELHIGRRSRAEYTMAARAALKAKILLEKEGRTQEWDTIYTTLRTRYKSLRALKEEMEALGLSVPLQAPDQVQLFGGR